MKNILFPVLTFLFLITSVYSFAATNEESMEKVKVEGAYPRVWAALSLDYVPVSYSKYEWMPGVYNDQTGRGAHLGLEFIFLDEVIGKLGVGTGVGLNWVANASVNRSNATLTTIPLEGYLSYYLDVLENQALVPFAKVGPSYTHIRQQGAGLEDINRYSYTLDYSVGAELFLNLIDKRSAASLYRTVGIQGSYLTFEYRNSKLMSGRQSTADLSHEQIRMGLRFEM